MPEFEGLLRAVSEGLAIAPEDVLDMSEAKLAAHIATAVEANKAPLLHVIGSAAPHINGELLRRSVEVFFDCTCERHKLPSDIVTESMEDYDARVKRDAWALVAADLVKS